MDLKVTDEALALLAEAGFDPVFGARPLKRAILDALKIRWPSKFEGKFGAKDMVKVGLVKGQIAFSKG